MRISPSVSYISSVILISIGISSQYDISPDGVFSSDVFQDHSPSPSPTKAPQRVRSNSPSFRNIEPPTKIPSSDGHQYELEQLQFIRLIPMKSSHREFELRRYTFPTDKAIKVRKTSNIYPPVPSREHIVVSTHDGEVIAIFTNENTLAGIYRYSSRDKRNVRVKINIRSETIRTLTSDEIEEYPVGFNRRLLNDFRIVHINKSDETHSSLKSSPAEPSVRARSRSPVSRCMTLPTRLPSADGKGYGLDQLQFIMLTPVSNPNRGFELRRYTFPEDSKLLLYVRLNHYLPIPKQEHIVLSTFSGDVFAILEDTNYLAGIYEYMSRKSEKMRVKINMLTGAITPMTTDEMKETRVGRLRRIPNYFRIQHVNKDHTRD